MAARPSFAAEVVSLNRVILEGKKRPGASSAVSRNHSFPQSRASEKTATVAGQRRLPRPFVIRHIS